MFAFFVYFLALILGLCAGSFLTALIYRIPRGIPWALGVPGQPAPRSICPPCGRQLTPRELIPVLSWVFQRGRCACGKTRVSVTYPLIELACGLVFLLVVMMFWGF